MKSSINTKGGRAIALFSLILAALFVFCCLPGLGCSLENNNDPSTSDATAAPQNSEAPAATTVKTEGNPVVIKSPAMDFTLYDFRQAYYSNQNYMYMMYGMLSPADYFNTVVDDAKNFLYVYNAAVDAGVELDSEELLALDESFDSQLENIIGQYQNDVDESITGDEARRAAAIEKLNQDLENDGLDYETFISLSRRNMRMYNTADKYYNQLLDEVEVDDAEVTSYIEKQLTETSGISMEDFRNAYEAYSAGQGPYPVYIPDDCFSVDHIFLQYETEADGQGGITYLMDSTKETESAIEAKLPETADFDAFMELEVEYGTDPGMDDEGYRENGYLIHPDFDSTYFTGFVYAGMNLYSKGWTPEPNAETGETYELPELTFFELADGTPVVKVATESGVHYMIINKTLKKGAVEYEIGDAHWMSWKDSVAGEKFTTQFEELRKGWEEKYNIEVLTDVFRAEFVPPEENGGTDSDGKKD